MLIYGPKPSVATMHMVIDVDCMMINDDYEVEAHILVTGNWFDHLVFLNVKSKESYLGI